MNTLNRKHSRKVKPDLHAETIEDRFEAEILVQKGLKAP
jgi:hypothetical protein